jgi:predicted RNA binding protein YcfA (HicA-like mRNA interferase family)
MSKTYSGKEIKTVLEKLGFVFKKQKGSHIKMEKAINNKKITIIVPNHKTIKKGTLNNILKKVNINIEDLKKYI